MKKTYLSLIGAYLIWMFAIPFWKLFAGYSGLYILNIRFVWSMIFMMVFLGARGELKTFFSYFRDKRHLTVFLASGAALYGNWLCNTVAPMIDQILEVSIGQYLSPILLIFLGSLLFREKLSPVQWGSSLLALSGLLVILIAYGAIPWIILLVSSTFFLLTILVKGSTVPSIYMTAAQLIMISPLALCAALRYEAAGSGFYSAGTGPAQWLAPVMISCVSIIPVLMFNRAVKKLSSVTLGFFQYLGPTLSMFMGVVVYHEALDISKLVALILIWTGILIYALSQMYAEKGRTLSERRMRPE